MSNRHEVAEIAVMLKNAAKSSQDEVAEYLQKHQNRWGQRNNGLFYYDLWFSKVLGNRSIAEYIPRRTNVYGLDLMGEGQFLIDLGIKGLGVTVIYKRDEQLRSYETERGIEILATTFTSDKKPLEICDIFTGVTRRRIRQYLKQHNLQSFDTIVCRPHGAIKIVPKDPSTCYFLINQFWRMLSPENGILLTQFPGEVFPEVDHWLKILQENKIDAVSGPDFLWGGGNLRLVRNSQSPENLPVQGKLLPLNHPK